MEEIITKLSLLKGMLILDGATTIGWIIAKSDFALGIMIGCMIATLQSMVINLGFAETDLSIGSKEPGEEKE